MSELLPLPASDTEGAVASTAPRAEQATSPQGEDTRIAVEIRGLVERGATEEARERFAALVASQQRRASRIAFQYLRDGADADEAVQDAFIKAFSHIATYREAWPFEVWFTRILINGCLDRRKARARRDRWVVPADEVSLGESRRSLGDRSPGDPEQLLLARERRARLARAVDQLDGRQRSVFVLCHYADYTAREVSEMTGLNESTVRVHLFRAARKLRAILDRKA